MIVEERVFCYYCGRPDQKLEEFNKKEVCPDCYHEWIKPRYKYEDIPFIVYQQIGSDWLYSDTSRYGSDIWKKYSLKFFEEFTITYRIQVQKDVLNETQRLIKRKKKELIYLLKVEKRELEKAKTDDPDEDSFDLDLGEI